MTDDLYCPPPAKRPAEGPDSAAGRGSSGFRLVADVLPAGLDRDRVLLDMDIRERRWALWARFLVRESIASVLGGVLLILFAGVFVMAMFIHAEPPAILGNSFLIILGYFFGQSVGRQSDSNRRGSAAPPAVASRERSSEA
jgi:hypothetical protein